MKNIILASALLMTTPASAGVSWVQTPFWQTAYVTNYSAELQNTDKEIASECHDFERFVYGDEGVEKGDLQLTDPADFQTLNQLGLPSDMTHASFYLEMKLAVPSTLVLEDLTNSDLKTLTDQKAKTDLIPSFTQNPTVVMLQPESLQGPIRVEKLAKSLLGAADKLKVPASGMKFVRRGSGYYLVFSSKDAACDILARRATLNLDARVGVKISLQNQLALQEFYSSVQRIGITAIEKTKSPRVRAALLGFQLGEFLSRNTSNEIAESQMLGLITRLFEVESMAPNKYWTDAFGKKVLSVTGTVEDQKAALQIVGPHLEVK